MFWRFGRAFASLIAALGFSQLTVGASGAVMTGKDGRLLFSAPQGTRFGGAAAAPMGRVADCTQGLPNELWTVRPGGRGLARVGRGDYGGFSPDGRLLITSFSPGCYAANALSLSRAPFHREHPIPGADFINYPPGATLGPWLGPERPAFVDPNGNYRDGITGRVLLRDRSFIAGTGSAMSCSGRVADPDGMIGTPVRASGRVNVLWRRINGRGWLGDANETSVQWSPDGRYVYFTTRLAHSDRLWRVDADGTARRLLLRTPASASLASELSPDGRWISVTTLTHGGEQLSVMAADGRRLHRDAGTPAGSYLGLTAEWSPRGDLLLVASDTVTGGTSVYTVPAGGGPRHYLPLLDLGVWSPDERFIADATSATSGSQGAVRQKLVIVSVATGRMRSVMTALLPNPLEGSNPGRLTIADWQAIPGTARQIRCVDGQPPF